MILIYGGFIAKWSKESQRKLNNKKYIINHEKSPKFPNHHKKFLAMTRNTHPPTNLPNNFRGCSGMEGDEEEEGAVTGRLTLVPSIARSSSSSSSSVLSSSSSSSSSSPSRPSPPPPCLVWPGEGHRGESTGETLQ